MYGQARQDISVQAGHMCISRYAYGQDMYKVCTGRTFAYGQDICLRAGHMRRAKASMYWQAGQDMFMQTGHIRMSRTYAYEQDMCVQSGHVCTDRTFDAGSTGGTYAYGQTYAYG